VARLVGAVALVLMLAQGTVRVQSPDTSQLPHAFPRQGATRLLDNDWGTVWDVTWAPGSSTAMHRHAFDYVGVELTDSRVNSISPDGQRRTIPLKRGASYFLPRGTTHIEELLDSYPARHAVMIDLKDTAAPSFENSSRSPTAFGEGAATKVVDNARVVIWDYTWPTRQGGPSYFFDKNAFIVFLDRGELTSSVAGQKPQTLSVAAGQVLFQTGGEAAAEWSTKGDVRGIIVELK
jgi:uncharacterized protein YjlB